MQLYIATIHNSIIYGGKTLLYEGSGLSASNAPSTESYGVGNGRHRQKRIIHAPSASLGKGRHG